jgi:hypothetical protein
MGACGCVPDVVLMLIIREHLYVINSQHIFMVFITPLGHL